MEVKYSPFRFSSCVIVRCNLVMQFSGESSVASVYYCSTESRSLDFTSKQFKMAASARGGEKNVVFSIVYPM